MPEQFPIDIPAEYLQQTQKVLETMDESQEITTFFTRET
jgi:hypothetical protein